MIYASDITMPFPESTEVTIGAPRMLWGIPDVIVIVIVVVVVVGLVAAGGVVGGAVAAKGLAGLTSAVGVAAAKAGASAAGSALGSAAVGGLIFHDEIEKAGGFDATFFEDPELRPGGEDDGPSVVGNLPPCKPSCPEACGSEGAPCTKHGFGCSEVGKNPSELGEMCPCCDGFWCDLTTGKCRKKVVCKKPVSIEFCEWDSHWWGCNIWMASVPVIECVDEKGKVIESACNPKSICGKDKFGKPVLCKKNQIQKCSNEVCERLGSGQSTDACRCTVMCRTADLSAFPKP